MDNHFPKGPHIHIKNLQVDYNFMNLDRLAEDFKKLVLKYFGEKV